MPAIAHGKWWDSGDKWTRSDGVVVRADAGNQQWAMDIPTAEEGLIVEVCVYFKSEHKAMAWADDLFPVGFFGAKVVS